MSSAHCTSSSVQTNWPCWARAIAACVCASAAAPLRSARRRAVSSLSVAPSASWTCSAAGVKVASTAARATTRANPGETSPGPSPNAASSGAAPRVHAAHQ